MKLDLGETYKAVVVDGKNVLLLGDEKAKAATSGDPIDVITVIELVVESLRHSDGLGGISILNDDQMVRLEKGSPLLQKVKVPDGRDDDVQFIGQWWYDGGRRDRH
ncbi:hypothetical protein Ccrd_015487 [Cynara cardunculus var. scolymus]|uniref:Uncharacterized protein n=1 Tax=Cynara cardunculus var. scolymus TaxID=59895 RepID=A0A103YBT6_CYNCS|nr:hypothetical protein Ccrd_015487 [Cynara cardunculus var. scolymus]